MQCAQHFRHGLNYCSNFVNTISACKLLILETVTQIQAYAHRTRTRAHTQNICEYTEDRIRCNKKESSI